MVASGTRNAAGDLRGGEPADRAQRERELRRGRRAPDGSTGRAGSSVSSWSGAPSSGAATTARRPGGAASASSRRRRALGAAQLVDQPPRRDRDAARPAGGRAARRPATAPRRRAAPPAPRPRTRRSARSGGPARRGPAARARAAGPRRARRPSRRPSIVIVPAASCISGRTSTLTDPGERHPRRDLERRARGSRSRRCRSCPGTPWPRGTDRRSRPGCRRRACTVLAITWSATPYAPMNSPDALELGLERVRLLDHLGELLLRGRSSTALRCRRSAACTSWCATPRSRRSP